ncbi:hypothetical protein [Candidatus Palauibacter sp.]|uniref:hypothetical protein n=1 Tax=Candidatus Palauibacter sp. TaxID=3101350 RepID=UPI003B0266EE
MSRRVAGGRDAGERPDHAASDAMDVVRLPRLNPWLALLLLVLLGLGYIGLWALLLRG